MTRVRTMRLVCSGLWVDVRLTELKGRWRASADTPDGLSLGMAWFFLDALEVALEPFDGFVDELLDAVPADLGCVRPPRNAALAGPAGCSEDVNATPSRCVPELAGEA